MLSLSMGACLQNRTHTHTHETHAPSRLWQAEARLARLKKDMKLVKGKGEEEEMKDYMKQASQGLILTSASMHGPGNSGPDSNRTLQTQRSLGSER